MLRFVLERGEFTGQHEDGAEGEEEEADEGDDAAEKDLELLGVEFAAQIVDKRVDLAQAEHAESRHVLRGQDGLRGETAALRYRINGFLAKFWPKTSMF